MSFLAALQFLTAIPLPRRLEVSPERSGRAAGYFPVIGLIIGLILAGLNWLLSLILPLAIVHALLIAFLVLITGALHLDGFVDTCDGLGGHKTVAERWAAMRDSRAGSFGIIGVVLLLLVKYVSLQSIPQPVMTMTLVLMPVLSRWAMVYTIYIYPYARPEGLGKAFKQGTRWPSFAMATVIMLAAALILGQLSGLAMLGGVWVITVVMAAYFRHRFAGMTGDTYGAINELTEVSVLILVVLLSRLGII